MAYRYSKILWIGAYLAAILAPLFILLLGDHTPPTSFWWDFAIALGFSVAAMMGIMFFLTARFRRVSAPFGIDLIYYFHRQIALVAFFLMVLHPLILIGVEPLILEYLKPDAPKHMLAGTAAFVCVCLLIVSSVLRKQLGINYETWRTVHAILAVVTIILVMFHIIGVKYYVASSWKSTFWISFALFWLALLVYVRLIKPIIMLKRPYYIDKIIEEQGNANTLVIKPKDHTGLSFLPGQFIWLTLWHSPFSLNEHPFSISSSAVQSGSFSVTIKALGDFTSEINTVQPGEPVYIDGPYGAFSVDRYPKQNYAFIAGGIGIAPIMSMLRTLSDRSDQRPLILFYCYKSLEYMTFYQELEALRKSLNIRVIYVLSDPDVSWTGECGYLDCKILEKYLPANKTTYDYFICGPIPMMASTEKMLHRLGIPLTQTHSEIFNLV
ncbi:MAG: ferric reductase-like transmembrane domain-containing protein [Gammaproteobacteria bacterium]|nr:ferric reductase-like transmembrane domain-containing protein [Gammaproteobacteria bacterium]